MKFSPVSIAIALVLGTVLGFLSPGKVAATVSYIDVYLHPGATSVMNCGWHTACVSPYYAGPALDWQNGGGAGIYWRHYGFRSDVSYGSIGTGSIALANGTCKALAVNVTDSFGFFHGQIRYEHSEYRVNPPQPYYSFGLYAGWGGPWQDTFIGITSSDEFANCKNQNLWTGPHLHQQPNDSYFYNNYGRYPYATTCNATPCASFPSYTSPGWHESEQHWCWFC